MPKVNLTRSVIADLSDDEISELRGLVSSPTPEHVDVFTDAQDNATALDDSNVTLTVTDVAGDSGGGAPAHGSSAA